MFLVVALQSIPECVILQRHQCHLDLKMVDAAAVKQCQEEMKQMNANDRLAFGTTWIIYIYIDRLYNIVILHHRVYHIFPTFSFP